jgi:hypothetical protein
VRVYDALWETDKIQLISFQIEQILWSNVWINTWVLRRFIEIYEPNYLKKYADDALKKYRNWRFDREEVDERYENSLQSLYTTIQESYITLMVHSRTTWKLWDSYRDILVSMQEPNEITLIYMLLAYEHVWDSVAIERLRPLLASTDRRILWLIRTFNRLYLWEYTQAVRELADTADELTDLDILWLSWRVRKDQGLPNSNQVSQLTQLLEATNEETITLEAWFEAHFATVTWKIRKFYPSVENDTQKE